MIIKYSKSVLHFYLYLHTDNSNQLYSDTTAAQYSAKQGSFTFQAKHRVVRTAYNNLKTVINSPVLKLLLAAMSYNCY